MAQLLRELAALVGGHEFSSQQPHSGLQPSIMESDALFWDAGIHVQTTCIHINKKKIVSRRWWLMPLILTLGRQRQIDLVSLKSAWSTA